MGSAQHLDLFGVPMVSVGPCFCLQDAEAQIDEHVRKSKDQMSFFVFHTQFQGNCSGHLAMSTCIFQPFNAVFFNQIFVSQSMYAC